MYACLNLRAMGKSLSAARTIELAARAGFTGVDLAVRDLLEAGEDPRELRSRMNGLGLRGGAWPLPVAWRGDASAFARDLEGLPQHARAAESLGLLRTGTYVMYETPARPGPGADAASYLGSVAELHVERLAAVARILGDHGIRLGLEAIGVESVRTGAGLPFVTRTADLDTLLGSIWRVTPNVGVILDAFHLHAAAEPIAAALAWGVDRVVWVHLADLPAGSTRELSAIVDTDRGLPGENGAVDSVGILRRMVELGYAGPVTAEPMAGCRTLAGVSAEESAYLVAASLRSVWPGGGF
jgi:sugar phosphate isomerase/epimerase